MIRLLYIVLVVFISATNAAEKPILRVVSEEWSGYTNKDLSGTYWDIIRKVYGDDYTLKLETVERKIALNLASQNKADIVIGVYQNQRESILTPRYHIDMDSPMFVVFDGAEQQIESIDDLSNLIVVGKKGYIIKDFLPKSASYYPVESLKSIHKLIFNQRINAALIYDHEMYIADPKSLLSSTKVIPKRKMYLGFAKGSNTEALMQAFDEKFEELIVTNKLESLFENKTTYDFAEYSINNDKPAIQWQIMPKVFNSKSKRLDTTFQDRQISTLLKEYLPNYYFNFQFNSSNTINKKMVNLQLNTCAVNVFKTKAREKSLLFSNPIYAYIKPRIIFLEKNTSNLPPELTNEEEINIISLLEDHPTLRIAIRTTSNSYKQLKNILTPEHFSRIHSVETDLLQNIFSLLYKEKIDAVIMWPTIVADTKKENHDAKLLKSVAIRNNLGNTAMTYIACNNTEFNNKLLQEINDIMKKPAFQEKLFHQLLNDIDPQSAAEFKRTLNLTF